MNNRQIRSVVTAITSMLILTVLFACSAPSIDTTAGTSPTPSATPAPQSTLAITPREDSFAEQRRKMVEQQIEARGINNPRVLEAMQSVPRHEFVPAQQIPQAYQDHPLPIGYGQTISQPYIVALMTEKLDLEPGDKVLEIGTGSGYQAAVLAEITDQVYTVEIIPELAERAAKTLQETGYTEVKTLDADGYYGWEEHAPYDAIVVTAAPDHVPRPLIQQLKDGGRLVIPVGPPGGYQTLWQLTKQGDDVTTRNLGGVRFVPFTGAGVREAEPESVQP